MTPSPTDESILRTLLYADVFDYPLTPEEIHQYLIGRPVPREDVQNALVSSAWLAPRITRVNGYFAVRERQANGQVRNERRRASSKLWPLARRWAYLAACLPFVRMVAVTGALAMDNSPADDDIDFLIVTEPGRVWLTRALSIALVRVARLFGVGLCPNYVLAQSALAQPRHDLFVAHELAQMRPLLGFAVYEGMRAANRWAFNFLPHARRPLRAEPELKPRPLASALKRLGEWLLSGPLGDALEAWERNRKLRKFASAAQSLNSAAQLDADHVKGHFADHGQIALKEYESRLAQHALATPDAGRWTGDPKTDVLFGQSYYLRFDPKLWEAGQPYPPLGTLYAASYARSRGYSVALFDAVLAESEDEWAAALDREQPRFACIFEDNFNYLSKMCLLRMREAAFKMIAMAKQRGCTVILCGADMTDHTDEYFARGADFILLGEGELTLGELLDSLTGRSTQPLEQILGLAVKSQVHSPQPIVESPRPGTLDTGHWTSNPRRADIRDLDSLPFPAWDLVDLPRYQRLWRKRHGYYSMNLVTTRGCPFHCNWCAKPIWGQRYNSRSPENVAAEVKRLKAQYHPDHLWFADDIFGLKPGWIERFAELVRAEGAAIPFKCLQRADLITEKVAAALASAGCRTVWLGAESGSQKILDAMDKGQSVRDIYTATARLRAHGIEVGFFLQFGYPGEEWDDVQLTLKMVRECLPDDIGISVSYPLPGTRFFERVKRELGEKQNWVDSNDLAMLYRGPFPEDFYRALHSRVHHEFRLRRAWQKRDWKRLAYAPYHLFGVLRAEARLRSLAHRYPGRTELKAALQPPTSDL